MAKKYCKNCKWAKNATKVWYENPMEVINNFQVNSCYVEIYNEETDGCDCGNYMPKRKWWKFWLKDE